MNRIGLVTFHAAYNHGSVLQALATQTAIDRIAGDGSCSIVNYRTREQREYYCKLYRTKYGLNFFARDLLQFPVARERKQRMANFERFMARSMNLTSEVSEPEEAAEQMRGFSTMVSGSDQIWSKHTCESEHADWKYMDPYLLKGYEGRKVSYATSIGSMTDEELVLVLPAIAEYDRIAVREQVAADRLSRLLDREVEVVLDPTLLLDHDAWKKRVLVSGVPSRENYLLYYTLGGFRAVRTALPEVERFAHELGLSKMVVIAPFTNYRTGDAISEAHPECGPLEFLNYLESASYVVTDSYHGTLFSVNFGKDMYSLCLGTNVDYRKEELLGRIGLGERVICSLSDLRADAFDPIEYTEVHGALARLRAPSVAYLKEALGA